MKFHQVSISQYYLETSAMDSLEECSKQMEWTARRSHKQEQQGRALPSHVFRTVTTSCSSSLTVWELASHAHTCIHTPLLAYSPHNSPTPLQRQTSKEPELGCTGKNATSRMRGNSPPLLSPREAISGALRPVLVCTAQERQGTAGVWQRPQR